MKQANVKFTYNDYLLLPNDRRYEIVDGELRLVPAPEIYHQRISRNLEFVLGRHIRQNDLGEMLHAPCDVLLSQKSVVQPDILFVAKDRLRIIGTTCVKGPPDLLIEILSKGTKDSDLVIKRKLYARFGVKEYWVVDPDTKTVEVLLWNETGYRTAAVYAQTGRVSSPLFPKLNMKLTEIF